MSEKIVLIQPVGLLDSTCGKQIREQLLSALAAGAQTIEIDCGAITLMDSNGFSFLIACLKKSRESGTRLQLRHMNSQMRLVLEMTGTDGIFEIVDEGDSANS